MKFLILAKDLAMRLLWRGDKSSQHNSSYIARAEMAELDTSNDKKGLGLGMTTHHYRAILRAVSVTNNPA
ncbi:hypothetical protein ACYZT7_06755 [Pseudomonas sp. RT4P38]